MNDQIKITISGPMGSGKSTIAWEILDALANNGFNVIMDNERLDEEAPPEGLRERRSKRRMCVMERTKESPIAIKTVNTNRLPTNVNWDRVEAMVGTIEEWTARKDAKVNLKTEIAKLESSLTGKPIEDVFKIVFERVAKIEARLLAIETVLTDQSGEKS